MKNEKYSKLVKKIQEISRNIPTKSSDSHIELNYQILEVSKEYIQDILKYNQQEQHTINSAITALDKQYIFTRKHIQEEYIRNLRKRFKNEE
ncbi:MAG: hypothetical protein PF542_04095 [Nanoarchaeota archaeon]|jgi:hypothetical protein|nr:hypothetical protein [Nanoarchaeota archaeon]